jgi:hypothetical protein
MTGTDLFGIKTCQGLDDFLRPEHLISSETRLFCKTLRKFVDKEVLPHEEEMDEFWDWTEREGHNFVHDIWKKLLIDVGLEEQEAGQRWSHVPLSKRWREAISVLHIPGLSARGLLPQLQYLNQMNSA